MTTSEIVKLGKEIIKDYNREFVYHSYNARCKVIGKKEAKKVLISSLSTIAEMRGAKGEDCEHVAHFICGYYHIDLN